MRGSARGVRAVPRVVVLRVPRIGDVAEMDEIGYEDYFYGDGVCIIEWANLIEELLPEDCIDVQIEKDLSKGFDYRRITIRQKGEAHEDTRA